MADAESDARIGPAESAFNDCIIRTVTNLPGDGKSESGRERKKADTVIGSRP